MKNVHSPIHIPPPKNNYPQNDITILRIPFCSSDDSYDTVIKTSRMTLDPASIVPSTLNSNNVVTSSVIPSIRDCDVFDNNSISTNIDSALLSALHDPRERLALLKLEHSLIEFMNDVSTSSMEVGGPYNSIILRASRTHITEFSGYDDSVRSNYSTILAHKSQFSQNVDVHYYGSRQTSFQRLCLHRLADRFNIVRETTYGGNNCSLSSINPTLIRLIKVTNSCIPDDLLINLDVSSSIIKSSQKDKRCIFDNFTSMLTNDVNPTDFPGLETRLASSQLYDSNCRPLSLTPNNCGLKQMKKKVMIMKRRSSTSLNNSKDNSGFVSAFTASDRLSHTLKGKNLPDKERAYAEARARIFNSCQKKTCSLSIPEAGESLRDVLSIPSESLSFGSEKPPSSSGSLSSSEVCVLPSSNPIISTDDGIDSRSVLVIQSSFFSEKIEATDDSDGGSLNVKICNSSKSSNLPVAATVGAASKVTWRNRRQEESDPDFQRGIPINVTHMPLSSVVFPPQPRHHPQSSHHQFQSTLLTGSPVLFHHSTGYLDFDNSNSTVFKGNSSNIYSSQIPIHIEDNNFPLRKNHPQMSFISDEQFRYRQPKRNLQCNTSGKQDINKQSISDDMLMRYSSAAVNSTASQSSSWSLWPSTSDNNKNNVTHLYPEKFPALG